MRINLDQTRGLLIHFPPNELRVALSVLMALYTVSKASFIREAIEEIKMMLRPRLTLVSHNHLCESCFRMVDDQGDNAIHMTGIVDKWKHRNCLPLKQDRPD